MTDITYRELRNNSPMLLNLAKAVARAGVKPGKNPQLPAIGLRLKDVLASGKHVKAYRKVCGFSDSDYLPITYPHMHAFPLQMALMLDKDFPFPVMGLVHVRNNITQYRPIGVKEQLDVEVHLANLEKVDKGYEFAHITRVSTAGEPVWESESVYFMRWGKSDKKKTKRDEPEPVTNAEEWKVPGNIGRRYAKVSGDRNPIHLYALSAKLFGFKRQIAHGMWSKARCLAALENQYPEAPVRADVQFKLPMFTPAKVKFATEKTEQGLDFGLYAKDGIKPHLAGQLYTVK